MSKRKEKPVIYANVCIRDGMRIYTSFGTDLEKMIADAEFMYGIVAIEQAHAGKEPEWVRNDELK